MGKHGPCYHCGVTSTPLWRNGPPDKPVLCNACGSRWRTKGTLANYTPLHSRMDPDDYEDQKACKVKIVSINKNKLKQKHNHGFRKAMDDSMSNRSSSGSAISNPESCAQLCSAEASDLTGPAQSVVWDSTVPPKKRTCVGQPKQSSVEKLAKDLHTILDEQQSSYFSGSSEEDLLFETGKSMVSVEIGHGSVLIRHPSSIAREEESEASSLSVDNKHYSANEIYSNSSSLNHRHDNKNVDFLTPGTRRMKNTARKEVHQEQFKRDKSHHEKLLVLGNRDSPLCDIDLNDVINFEEFRRQLTSEEQRQLTKDLPLVEAAECPDSCDLCSETKPVMESSKMVAPSPDLGDDDGFCFSPRTLFAAPQEGTSLVLETLNFAGGRIIPSLRPSFSVRQQALELNSQALAAAQHVLTSLGIESKPQLSVNADELVDMI